MYMYTFTPSLLHEYIASKPCRVGWVRSTPESKQCNREMSMSSNLEIVAGGFCTWISCQSALSVHATRYFYLLLYVEKFLWTQILVVTKNQNGIECSGTKWNRMERNNLFCSFRFFSCYVKTCTWNVPQKSFLQYSTIVQIKCDC